MNMHLIFLLDLLYSKSIKMITSFACIFTVQEASVEGVTIHVRKKKPFSLKNASSFFFFGSCCRKPLLQLPLYGMFV